MVLTSQKESIVKSKLKKRIMNLIDGSTSSFSEADLDRLSVEKLRNIHLIAKTMRMKKPA